MKLSRRKMFGAMAGAAAATQMDSAKSNLVPTPPYSSLNEVKQLQGQKLDPEYFRNEVKRWKKVLAGDFSDYDYNMTDNTRGMMYANVESLKSISPAARQLFIENAQNNRQRRELVETAKNRLDEIMGLPFSVTGILFK